MQTGKANSTEEIRSSVHCPVLNDSTMPGTMLDKEEVQPVRFLSETRGKGTNHLEHLLCARDLGGVALCHVLISPAGK